MKKKRKEKKQTKVGKKVTKSLKEKNFLHEKVSKKDTCSKSAFKP